MFITDGIGNVVDALSL